MAPEKEQDQKSEVEEKVKEEKEREEKGKKDAQLQEGTQESYQPDSQYYQEKKSEKKEAQPEKGQSTGVPTEEKPAYPENLQPDDPEELKVQKIIDDNPELKKYWMKNPEPEQMISFIQKSPEFAELLAGFNLRQAINKLYEKKGEEYQGQPYTEEKS